MINSGAYTKQNLGFATGTRSLESIVGRFLKRFLQNHGDPDTYQTETYFSSLLRQARTSKNKTSKRYTDEALKKLPTKVSTEKPLEIKDRSGVVLGYRFRLPIQLVEQLEESERHLPPLTTSKKHKRGSYAVRHYAHWADYNKNVFTSSDYKNQKKDADKWFEANKALFDYLGNFLRMYNPEMWVTMTKSISDASGGRLSGLAGPWHGVAIGQGMGSEGGENHQDWRDRQSVFNAVVPFGAGGWKGGEVVLWQLGIKVAVERGDCFMFRGAVIAHKACAITEGHRNFVDLFCHQSVWDVRNRKREESDKPYWIDTRKVCFMFSYT